MLQPLPKFRLVKEAPESMKCDLLALPIFTDNKSGPGAKEVAALLGTTLKDLLSAERVKGEVGDCLVLPTYGRIPAKKVAFVGLGKQGKASSFEIRRAGAVLARRTAGAKAIGALLPAAVQGVQSLQAFAEGFLLGSYKFDRYKASSKNGSAPQAATDVLIAGVAKSAAVDKAIARAEVIAEATMLARDLANTPALDKSPSSLVDEAKRIAKGTSIAVKVFDEKQLAAKGMNGILGVGRGSPKESRMIEMVYKAPGAKKSIAIIGKGIIFDSGGMNLKLQGLDWMKMDMGGAASVLGVMQAVAALKPKVNVTGIICSAENMLGGNALHTGDVLTMYGGKTVEVANTDAEGRLVMADGLVYAAEKKPDYILDIATLTGACMVALGQRCFGILGSDPGLVRGLLAASERAGEQSWELPLIEDYRKLIDSDIADLKNIGGPYAGAITAGLFLREFVDGIKWAHLDVAGAMKGDSDEYEQSKGATGAGTRTLIEWVLSL
ncbi:MAG: leucyl aminopeptidase [Actinomycetota bacterium]